MQDERDIEELQALTKRSADGVIHFNPQLFDQYAAGRRRPYSLIFFLTAAHLQDKSSLGLRALRKQYGLLAKVTRFPISHFIITLYAFCNDQQNLRRSVHRNIQSAAMECCHESRRCAQTASVR